MKLRFSCLFLLFAALQMPGTSGVHTSNAILADVASTAPITAIFANSSGYSLILTSVTQSVGTSGDSTTQASSGTTNLTAGCQSGCSSNCTGCQDTGNNGYPTCLCSLANNGQQWFVVDTSGAFLGLSYDVYTVDSSGNLDQYLGNTTVTFTYGSTSLTGSLSGTPSNLIITPGTMQSGGYTFQSFTLSATN